MSKSVKRFLPIAAAIAIPFVAGPLGVALAGSALFSGTALGGFLASTGGAALLGGLMGAGVGAISGGGLQGALIGGATGALGGFAGAGGFSGLGEVASATAGTPSAVAPATATTAVSPSISLTGAPAAAGTTPFVTGADTVLTSGLAGQLTNTAATAATAVPVGGLTGVSSATAGSIPAGFTVGDLTTAAANAPTITGSPSGGFDVSRVLSGLGKAENLLPLMQTGMQVATADPGMSDAEQAAFNAKIDELKRQGRDAEALQLDQMRRARMAEQTAMQQGPRTAEAYTAGQLSAEREVQRNLRSAGVQGYSPQQLAAIQRSGSIGASQVAGTRAAQEQARGESALRAGLNTASSMYPTKPTVSDVPAYQLAEAQAQRLREDALYGGLETTLSNVAGRLGGAARAGDYTYSLA